LARLRQSFEPFVPIFDDFRQLLHVFGLGCTVGLQGHIAGGEGHISQSLASAKNGGVTSQALLLAIRYMLL